MKKREEIREVSVRRNGVGYLLQAGERTQKITPIEIERLMESILRNHPGVPDGVAAAWENRYAPVIELTELYGVVDMEVVVTGYQAMVFIVGEDLSHMRTPTCESPEAAVAEMETRWGGALHVLPEYNKLSSSNKRAKDDLVMLKAEEYCREIGITMDELWAQVSGEKSEKESSEQAETESATEAQEG